MAIPVFIKFPYGEDMIVVNIDYIVECYRSTGDGVVLEMKGPLESYKNMDITPEQLYDLIEEAKEREENRLTRRLEERGF